MFERIETALPGVIVIKPRVFGDHRGWFAETYNSKTFADIGIGDVFVQDNHSLSRRGTLRGLHYQFPHQQGKLCRVVRGEVFDVAVDIRVGSPTFGRWMGAVLSAENKHQIFIPRGFAHGFAVLSEEAEFLYKCTDFYDPRGEYGIHWGDPQLGIDWRIADPVISAKDSRYPKLNDISQNLLPHYEQPR